MFTNILACPSQLANIIFLNVKKKIKSLKNVLNTLGMTTKSDPRALGLETTWVWQSYQKKWLGSGSYVRLKQTMRG